jgi:hypothetical protein
MSRLSALVAAAFLAVLAARPSFAEPPVFGNPGAYATLHPYQDVLNGGAPTPAMKLSSDPAAMQAYAARESGIGNPSHSTAVNQHYSHLSSYRRALAWSRSSSKHRHNK